MDTKEIEKIIRNLGYTYKSLIANKIIDKIPAEHIYDDEDTIEVLLEKNLELVFWKASMIFEILLISDDTLSKELISILPEPLCNIGNRNETIKSLGHPIFEKSKIELMHTNLLAWDSYQLPETLHPVASLEIQYGENMQASTIIISLLDRQS